MTEFRVRIQRYGLGRTIQWAAFRAVNRLFFLKGFALLAAEVEKYSTDSPAPDSYKSFWANREQIMAWTRLPGLDMTEEFAEEALAAGDRCWAIEEDGTPISYAWYSTRPTEIMKGVLFTCDLPWNYGYKLFTSEAYRGKRLANILVAESLEALATEGYVGTLTLVETINYNPLRALKRVGFGKLGNAWVIGWRRPRWVWVTPGFRRTGMTLEVGPE